MFKQVKENYDLVAYCESLGWEINKSSIPYKCISPFRNETNPSFALYPDTQSWSDFGDGSGGDIITLVARLENISQSEAGISLAKQAGINIQGLSKEDLEKKRLLQQERLQCETILTYAAIYYHNCILKPPYSWVYENYYQKEKGFTKETIERFKLGFSDGRLIAYLSNMFSNSDLLKTGLARIANGQLVDYFLGRAIYPYWHQGRVVYMIARALPGLTPENKYECVDNGDYIKFKKLRIAKDGNYISSTIKNTWFYGLDSLGDAKEIIVTEGVADCISAIQCDTACISPVTTRFRKQDIDQLITLCKKANKVIICNDTELNKSGEKGAIETAIALAKNKINCYVATLPLGTGEEKVDINSYVTRYGKEAFTRVIQESTDIISFLISRITEEDKERRLLQVLEPILDICSTFDKTRINATFGLLKQKLGLSKDVLKGALAEHRKQKAPQELKELNLVLDTNGIPLDTEGNLALIFRHHPDITGTLGYNERKACECIMKPNVFSTSGVEFPQELEDTHISNAIVWLQEQMNITTKRTNAVIAAISEACRNKNISHVYDPINDYLESLPSWDGKSRIETVFIDHIGVKDTVLHRAYGRCFCISLVARVKQPGCKVDTIPILIGQQGQRKSTLFKHLVPYEEYFTDNKINLTDRDGKMALNGPWIIENSDLSSTRTIDIESFNALVSSSIDVYRRPWGRKIEQHPRRFVFGGTTNRELILKDLTGNRRSWPMHIGKKLVEKDLIDNRDQIFAEALYKYKQGEQWWLSDDIEQIREKEEDEYREENSDIDTIENYLRRKRKEFSNMVDIDIDYERMFDHEGTRIFITMIEASKINNLNTRASGQIARILRFLGWRRAIIWDQMKNKTTRIYFKKGLNRDKISDLYNHF